MTLQQWAEKYNATLHHDVSGARVFDRDIPNAKARWHLFHLSDAKVTAALSGPAYALTTHNPEE